MSKELPRGWVNAAICDLATNEKSIAYGVLKPGPRTIDGIPMLRITDIRSNQVDRSAIYLISKKLDGEFRRTRLVGGEILVSIQGTVGKVAIVPDDLAGANISRTVAVIPLALPFMGSVTMGNAIA